jgi:clan AA aspartic protease
MISGAVNSRLEAIVRLVVFDAAGGANELPAIIDTGFSGSLTMATSAIRSFGLAPLGRQRGILADGKRVLFDVFAGNIEWDGRRRHVEVQAADTEPLVGMALLDGQQLKIEVTDGGTIEIRTLA